MVIYKITNLCTSKIYIGKDKKNNPSYFGSGKLLLLAIKKYGKKNFRKEILETCKSIEELNEKEKYWITFFNSTNKKHGYNIAKGGEGGDTISGHPLKDDIGQKHSEWMIKNNPSKGKQKTKETIDKWRASVGDKLKGINNPNYGKKHSEKTKQKIKEKALGRIVSDETRKKISKANFGRASFWKGKQNEKHSKWMKENNPMQGKTHSQDIKDKISKANSKPKSENHKQKLREFSPNNKKCTINGVLYLSVAEASRHLNISESTIRDRVKNIKNKNYYFE